MRHLLIAVVLVAGQALAEQAILRTPDITVVLTQSPCTSPASKLVLAEDLPKMKQARVDYQSRSFGACWMLKGDQVLIIDDEGDGGVVPAAAFKPDGV